LIQIDAMCEAFNCLPGPGGLLDQDPYLIEGLFIVRAAKAEKNQPKGNKKKK